MATTTLARRATPGGTHVSVLTWLRKHPLLGYFLLAFGLEWVWQVPMYVQLHQQLLGPWVLLSPTAAGFIMAWVTGGRAGLLALLRQCVRWRVGLRWYAVVLFTMPVLIFFGLLAAPGAMAVLEFPSVSFLATYVVAIVFGVSGLFAAGIGEEPGWRGFALPLMQRRYGPLWGSLVLGSMWGVWHLPLWLFIPGHSGARSGLLGIGVPFLGWFAFIVGFAVLITWVFNHTRGSVLLAALFHASHNATQDTFAVTFLPSMFPPEVAAIAPIPMLSEAGVVSFAVLVILLTHGRLGYDAKHGR
jgi:membrane protease YdiL (CAAX protease family)